MSANTYPQIYRIRNIPLSPSDTLRSELIQWLILLVGTHESTSLTF
jgi:hypothetical protein